MRIVVCAAFVILGAASAAFAQTDPTSDISGQFTVLARGHDDSSSIGVGGRLTVGLSRSVSIDGEFTFSPHDDVGSGLALAAGSGGLVYKRHRADGLLGIKAGYRGQRLGIFGKVRPGFSKLVNDGVECRGDVCALVLVVVPEYRTEFLVDWGAVVELYPAHRWLVRLDVGDTVVRHGSGSPPCQACTTSAVTIKAGVGLRF